MGADTSFENVIVRTYEVEDFNQTQFMDLREQGVVLQGTEFQSFEEIAALVQSAHEELKQAEIALVESNTAIRDSILSYIRNLMNHPVVHQYPKELMGDDFTISFCPQVEDSNVNYWMLRFNPKWPDNIAIGTEYVSRHNNTNSMTLLDVLRIALPNLNDCEYPSAAQALRKELESSAIEVLRLALDSITEETETKRQATKF